MSKLSRDRVHGARPHIDRSFHSLVTLRRLAKWGLGPEPSDEAIAHEVTTRRSEFLLVGHLNILCCVFHTYLLYFAYYCNYYLF